MWKNAALAAVLISSMISGAIAATGTVRDVKHVVILTMENRSFDHYFGCFPGVRGFNDRNALRFPDGTSVFYQPQSTNYVWPILCVTQCIVDVAHDWNSGHAAWNNGKYDRWVAAKGPSAMPYFTRRDLAFEYALAEAYTVCDNYYCSVLGPTLPNRLYQMTGMIDPYGLAGGPVTNNYVPTNGFTWTTYPERLQSHGVTWKVYQQDYWSGNPLIYFAQYKQAKAGDPLYDHGVAGVTNVVAAFSQDVLSNTLPQVSWLVPGWASSEHPVMPPADGAILIKQFMDALTANPEVYNSTVFFITYDENGGFFDHVPSPSPPPGTADEFVGPPIGLGARVPMLIVSPWTHGGYVCSQVFDHTSLLRFLEIWTGVLEPNISAWRRQVCGDLTAAFDFANPNTNYPFLPDTVPITCSTGLVSTAPDPQVFPAPETGLRLARPLPYQLDGSCAVDCPNGAWVLELTNSGCASTHLALYANAYRTDGPWQYDISAGGGLAARFEIMTNGGGYDFSGYGPNGFLRRFAGNIQTNCPLIEVTSRVDASAGGIRLFMTNAGARVATFTVTNGYSGAGPWAYAIPPGQSAADIYYVVTNNNGWYDLSATVDIDPAFLRRFAGHIETGYAPPQLQTGPPALAAAYGAGNLLLSYPASAASGFVLEQTSDLAQWTPVNTPAVVSCDNAVVSLPAAQTSAYFRLRK